MSGETLRAIVLAGVIGLFAAFGGAAADDVKGHDHRLALQVDSADPATMNLAINNAMAAKRYYDSKGERLRVEIVAYGPGIAMFRADASPVKDRLEALKSSIPGVTLSMCGNAKAGMEKAEGHEIPVLDGARVVPAGIVRLMELQEQGWSYVRP
jgi:intracellular sulfur oxidation DsrE/DsrF family protein